VSATWDHVNLRLYSPAWLASTADMRSVGPRAWLPEEADRDILRRYKFRYDALYIKQQSFWLDLKLIALSLWITVRGKWEYRGRKF